MKPFIKIICLLAVSLLMFSCEERNTPNQGTDEYYVKYSISSSFYKFGNIEYADVNGTKRDHEGYYAYTSTKWSVTIGPVKKGFRAFVRYTSGSADVVKLEVSKNGGPFAQKATGTNSASYTINF